MKSVYPNRFFHGIRNAASFKSLSFIAAIFFYTSPVSAQSYYPGGLGNSNLVVWLNAGNSSSITQSAGRVSLWSELSGHSYNFSQGNATRQPSYTATGGPGSRPAISFNASGPNFLSRSSMAASLSYTGGVSSFAAASFNASPTAAGFERIYDFGNGQPSDNIWMGRQSTQANMGYEVRNGVNIAQTYTSSNAMVNGTNNIYEVVQQGGTAGTLSAVVHYFAGTAQASSGSSGSFSYVPNTIARNIDYIGRSNWAVDDYFSGTMSEILFYNTAMNTTRRRILENYLSAAWGLTVSATYYTPPTTTSWYSNLVGIGYTSVSDNFLADISGSTDGLGFSSGTGATDFLNTAGYVMAAHNQQTNTVNSAITITGIGSNLNKWNRSWNVQKTGGNSSGLITLNFNFSDYNGTAPTSTYSYGLLYNAGDGSFATGTNTLITLSNISIAGNIVSLTANAANLATGYYTIVWSTSSLLPVSLRGFTASIQTGNALLEWISINDISTRSFEIERSSDALHFTGIGTVAAKTNGAAASNPYQFTDYNPGTGINYYRLKIADADGKISYSPVLTIDFGIPAGSGLYVYSSPSADVLHITGLVAEDNTIIRIINTGGQTIKMMQQAASARMDIPLTLPGKGIYIVMISTGKTMYSRKIIKQ